MRQTGTRMLHEVELFIQRSLNKQHTFSVWQQVHQKAGSLFRVKREVVNFLKQRR
jgi:hypothetical protein